MNKRSQKLKEKGFTLLEIIISTALLAIIMGGIVSFGIDTLNSQSRSRSVQSALENAHFAIEVMNKRLRTSSVDAENSSESKVCFKDNVDDKDYCYQFDNNKLQVNGVDLVGSDSVAVDGSFEFSKSDVDLGDRGFVRISLEISYEGNGSSNKKEAINLQSMVSLRDYQ